MASIFPGMREQPPSVRCSFGSQDHRSGWLIRHGCDIPTVPINDPPFNGCLIVAIDMVSKWLQETGFLPELAIHVMERSPLRKIGGKWARWNGTLVEKASVLLVLRGSPGNADELALQLGDGTSGRSLRNILLADERFIRVSKRSFGLREWGLEEYSGIVDEISQRIDRAGYAVLLDSVVKELVSTFDVAASSVRTFAEAPRFVLENGFVRHRTNDEDIPQDVRIHTVASLFPDLPLSRVHFAVPANADIERGSGLDTDDRARAAKSDHDPIRHVPIFQVHLAPENNRLHHPVNPRAPDILVLDAAFQMGGRQRVSTAIGDINLSEVGGQQR